jgi:hypothetical protein
LSEWNTQLQVTPIHAAEAAEVGSSIIEEIEEDIEDSLVSSIPEEILDSAYSKPLRSSIRQNDSDNNSFFLANSSSLESGSADENPLGPWRERLEVAAKRLDPKPLARREEDDLSSYQARIIGGLSNPSPLDLPSIPKVLPESIVETTRIKKETVSIKSDTSESEKEDKIIPVQHIEPLLEEKKSVSLSDETSSEISENLSIDQTSQDINNLWSSIDKSCEYEDDFESV